MPYTLPAMAWTENDSRTFSDQGAVFVPDREAQIDALVSLIPAGKGPFQVLELGCGEGLLAEAVLRRHPEARVLGLDGSVEMRERATQRLLGFGNRFRAQAFQLEDTAWRRPQLYHDPKYDDPEAPLRAVLSSLVVHHLDGDGKRRLFADIQRLLAPGGALWLADLVEPTSPETLELAARAWDTAVKARSQQLTGSESAYRQFVEDGWNHYRTPDAMDRPSPLFDQLIWLREAGFVAVDVAWMRAGHAVYGGWKQVP